MATTRKLQLERRKRIKSEEKIVKYAKRKSNIAILAGAVIFTGLGALVGGLQIKNNKNPSLGLVPIVLAGGMLYSQKKMNEYYDKELERRIKEIQEEELYD